MGSTLSQSVDPDVFRACTISQNINTFPDLMDEMDSLLGEAWGHLGLADALRFLTQSEAAALDFVVLCLHKDDRREVLHRLIETAQRAGVDVILVSAEADPAQVHDLIGRGAAAFVPYPLHSRAFAQAVTNLHRDEGQQQPEPRPTPKAQTRRLGNVVAFQALAGGCGATSAALSFASALSQTLPRGETVCLVDLDTQFGAVGTYLNLPRIDRLPKNLAELQARLRQPTPGFSVLTAPEDHSAALRVPPQDIAGLLDHLRRTFDHVVIDLPTGQHAWLGVVAPQAKAIFAPMQADMRAVHSTLLFRRALAELSVPLARVRFLLSRVPQDHCAEYRDRMACLTEAMGITLHGALPDWGAQPENVGRTGTLIRPARVDTPYHAAIADLVQDYTAPRRSTTRAA